MKLKFMLSLCFIIAASCVFSSSFTPRGMYAGDIEGEIRNAPAGIVRVNLQNKPLCFASDNKIYDPVEVNRVLASLPASVQVLDLSLNRLPEEALPSFIPLLQKENFLWLDIVTNSGADSLEGIRNLTTAMGEASIGDKIKCLGKVIWVREENLEGAAAHLFLVEPFVRLHKEYYERRRSLDTASNLWTSLGLQ